MKIQFPVRQNPQLEDASSDIVRCDVSPWNCRTVFRMQVLGKDPAGGLPVAPPLVWTEKDNLLVYAELPAGPEAGGLRNRRDWWLIPADGEPSNLTAGMKEAPGWLFAEYSGKELSSRIDMRKMLAA